MLNKSHTDMIPGRYTSHKKVIHRLKAIGQTEPWWLLFLD